MVNQETLDKIVSETTEIMLKHTQRFDRLYYGELDWQVTRMKLSLSTKEFDNLIDAVKTSVETRLQNKL